MILYSHGDTTVKGKLKATNFDDDDYYKIQMAINKIAKAVSSTEFKNFVFLIIEFNCLNLFVFSPMSSAGNIPTSDKTE